MPSNSLWSAREWPFESKHTNIAYQQFRLGKILCIVYCITACIAVLNVVLGDIRKTHKTKEGYYETNPQVAKRLHQKRKEILMELNMNI